MSKKIWNPLAADTVTQINSTLCMLQEKSLSIIYNEVNPLDPYQHICQITWRNHNANRANSGGSFRKLEQYMFILHNNSYHCLLFDGSIIRANFEFEDNILLTQNLLWWPAPYNFDELLAEGYPPIELMNDFYGDPKWYEALKMRSPIRIDFDSEINTENHPQTHMHIQHEETRLSIQKPICFNKFVDFIFRNFYPDFNLSFSPYDFINYKVYPVAKISYRTSEIVI